MNHFNRNVLIVAALTFICQQCPSYAEKTEQSTDSLKDATFERSCHQDFDCNFKNTYTIDQVFLRCNDGKCRCENPKLPPLDAANYPVRYFEEQCFVDFRAPCGTENGLKLVCETGRNCVEGRCRSESEIRASPKGHYCNENIDCQDGLKCKINLKYFLPSYYCE